MTGRSVHTISAREIIEQVLDADSFRSWDVPPRESASGEYAAALERARAKSGSDEAVITGEGTVQGRPVAVIVGEFRFLGGSIGVAVADRIVAGFERATARRLPVLAATASGGTRMQEGTRAFVRMVSISAAVLAHKRAGLAYLVYLRHPTTGGVFASWGSMGHITVAQPGALVGFLGPRVYEQLYDEPFPSGVQTAENLQRNGLIDAVLEPSRLRSMVANVLEILQGTVSLHDASSPRVEPPGRVDDWAVVAASRAAGRPGLRTLLRRASAATIPLSGTGNGEADPTLRLALATISGRPVVVLGQDRRTQSGEQALGPEALRVAARGIRLAEELRLPIVTVIDTPGAALSREAEEGGLAAEIGRTMAALLNAGVPVVSVLLGQGAGGGAIALLPADRVIAAENSWLSSLPPEGASALVAGSTAADMARAQRVAAWHLWEDGIVDVVVPESGGLSPNHVCDAIVEAIGRSLDELIDSDVSDLLSARGVRFSRAARTMDGPFAAKVLGE